MKDVDPAGQEGDANPPVRRTWRDALAWAGAGLFAGGLVFALAGLALSFEPVADLAGMERVAAIPEDATGLWFLLILAAVSGLVVPHADITRATGDDTPLDGTAPRSHGRVHTLILAVGAALLSLLAVESFRRDALVPASIHSHAFTETGVLLWACTVVLALAGLLATVAGRPPRRGPGSLALPVVSLTASALAVVLVAGLAGSVTHPRTIHTVAADDPGDPLAVPVSVHGRGWTWERPAGVRVESVEAGPRGPVLLLPDGFIALDGATGEELWTYRELHRDDLQAQLFGGVAHLTHRPEHGTVRETLLDPATGELLAERPAADDTETYLPSASLHQYREGHGPWGIEARALERGTTGPGEPLWTFVPEFPDLFCELQPRPRTATGPATGDVPAVVVYACVGPEEYEDKTLEKARPHPSGAGDGYDALLAHGKALDSMVATVAALDPATGEEVWRYEHSVAFSWDRIDRADRSPPAADEAPAFELWADYELFLLDPRTGEPLGHPEEAHDRDGRFGPNVDRVLRADTGGAVLMMRGEYHGSDGPVDVLTTDPRGEVTARVTVDENQLGSDHFDQAVALADTLLVPYTDDETGVMSVYSAPLAGGDLGGEWLEAGTSADPDSRRKHRLIVVPGAVVSHSTGDSAEIHGLVP